MNNFGFLALAAAACSVALSQELSSAERSQMEAFAARDVSHFGPIWLLAGLAGLALFFSVSRAWQASANIRNKYASPPHARAVSVRRSKVSRQK